MTWVRFDDGVPFHVKIVRAGPQAAWLWACGMAHCNRYHTDGAIPKDMLDTIHAHRREWPPRVTQRLADRLVAVGLWHDRGTHYDVHDYADYQEEALKSVVQLRRDAARERKQRQRDREKIAMSGNGHAVTPRDGHTDGHAPRHTNGHAGTSGAELTGTPTSAMSQAPVPSRPVPSRLGEGRALARPSDDGGDPELRRWATWCRLRIEAGQGDDPPIAKEALERLWQAVERGGAAKLALSPDAAYEALLRAWLTCPVDVLPAPGRGKAYPPDRTATWLNSTIAAVLIDHLSGSSDAGRSVREEAKRRAAHERASQPTNGQARRA